jgi:DnaD/phage-associated family protein
MRQFQGFPARTEFASIPNAFFSSLLPEIDDLAELKTTLYVIAVLYRKKGYPRFVSFNELLANAALMSSLKGLGDIKEETLHRGLKMAAGRGTLLNMAIEKDGAFEEIYFLNDEAGRQAASKIESGELKIGGLKARRQPDVLTEEMPDIYTLYEQNIGMLTPMVADELREAEKLYPPEWLRDAIREAALHNKRNIKYISKILENWSVEGRSDGTYQRDSQKADPDRYIKGKYGHLVRRR